MSDFQRLALQRLIDKANTLGVAVPPQITHLCGPTNHGATVYANLHPDEGDPSVPAALLGCCMGATVDLADCTCWVPIFATEQAAPRPPASADDLQVGPKMCGDCAFRKGSPERSSEWEEEALFGLAASGTPFWCHAGMRKPIRWEHPAGLTVDGDPDDWMPPMLHGVPYRNDGQPALLCAGWMGHSIKTARVDA